MNMNKVRIPAVIGHDVKDGHFVELGSDFVPETVYVYKVNKDNKLDGEIEYSSSKSKNRFSLSSTTLYLPTCLKKDDRVYIKYFREIKGMKRVVNPFSY